MHRTVQEVTCCDPLQERNKTKLWASWEGLQIARQKRVRQNRVRQNTWRNQSPPKIQDLLSRIHYVGNTACLDFPQQADNRIIWIYTVHSAQQSLWSLNSHSLGQNSNITFHLQQHLEQSSNIKKKGQVKATALQCCSHCKSSAQRGGRRVKVLGKGEDMFQCPALLSWCFLLSTSNSNSADSNNLETANTWLAAAKWPGLIWTLVHSFPSFSGNTAPLLSLDYVPPWKTEPRLWPINNLMYHGLQCVVLKDISRLFSWQLLTAKKIPFLAAKTELLFHDTRNHHNIVKTQ